ncbi:lachesin-like [Tachypleus tridentatus]|uniref:lachesin-like n=1 Tax=Tachypleus tridentatus TaxID=6853 RepID=UPI003FD17736
MVKLYPCLALACTLVLILTDDVVEIGRSEYYGLESEPVFSEPVHNITVAVGRTASLKCVVEDLGLYRVAWLRVESKTILTIHHHVITRNYRIDLSHSDHRNWVLHIKNVQESDRGGYMCQINTVPMKSQVGYLDVVVPPEIIGPESSTDVLVREGVSVTLTCRTKGYPTPTISWRREDEQPVSAGNWKTNMMIRGKSITGETLNITKVSRLHMGAYLCIASNGVPPSVSRRIVLQVNFPPMIWIPHQLVGSLVWSNVTLECHTEAFPMSINYWTKEEGEMIVSDQKYVTETHEETYKVHMQLVILFVTPDDYGSYRCFAKNSLGSTEGSIRLYGGQLRMTDDYSSNNKGLNSLDQQQNSGSSHYSHSVQLVLSLIFWLTSMNQRTLR